jgi:hypothetical protein
MIRGIDRPYFPALGWKYRITVLAQAPLRLCAFLRFFAFFAFNSFSAL